MKGIKHIEISNRKAKFKFDLFRNITVVKGLSGTGKTTLYNMINDYYREGKASGINVSSEHNLVVLSDSDWMNQLKKTKNSIVFIDEGAKYLTSKDFASVIKKTDNYYVIFNREELHQLPISVEEIYTIKTSGKYHVLEKLYKVEEGHVYSSKKKKIRLYDVIITEDSKSGFQFYKSYFKDTGIKVETSRANTSIYSWLLENMDKKILVIADGAAFGAEMDKIMKLQAQKPENIKVCLPESFEWLILNSGIIKEKELVNILLNPSDYIESKDYFSWENYFEKYLKECTKDALYQYKKDKINEIYINRKNADKIIQEIKNAWE